MRTMPHRTRRGGKVPAAEPLEMFLDLRPKFESFLILKGLSAITVEGHADAVRRITSGFGTTHPTQLAIEEFVVALYKDGDASYSHKANNVKALEYWLEFIGEPRRFGRQKKPRRLITQTLSETGINRLFYVCRTPKEKAILALCACSGIRPKELCALRRCGLDLATRTLFVDQGKGSKDGLVELPSACVEIVMAYLAETPRRPDEYLFITYQGHQYTTGALRKLMKVLGRRAGFAKRVWPYQLRHSFATNLLIRGAHLFYIKDQMRHAWIDTTMHYLSSVPHLDSHERLFPKYF